MPPVPTTNARIPNVASARPHGILRGEALVVVIVPVEHELGSRRVEHLPEGLHPALVAVLTGAVTRVVEVREDVVARVRREVRLEPRDLGRRRAASADERAVRIEHDDVPRPEVVAVPAFPARPGGAAEVVEVRRRGRGRLVFVVPDRGPGARPVATPGRRVTVAEVGCRTVRIGDVTECGHGARDPVEQDRRGLIAGRGAVADISGGDDHGILGSRRRSRRGQQRRDDRDQQEVAGPSPMAHGGIQPPARRLSRVDSSATGRRRPGSAWSAAPTLRPRTSHRSRRRDRG